MEDKQQALCIAHSGPWGGRIFSINCLFPSNMVYAFALPLHLKEDLLHNVLIPI